MSMRVWEDDAACRRPGVDPDLFAAPDSERPESAAARRFRERAARMVCAQCPVWRACLYDAIRTGERHSVRGGLSPRERDASARRRERRQARRAAAAIVRAA